MYMNYKNIDRYQQCENTYIGYIKHFDALSIIEVVHQTNISSVYCGKTAKNPEELFLPGIGQPLHLLREF